MAKIKIDSSGFITSPNFILQNRRFENIGFIGKIFNLTYKENFNSANEINGTIYKNINGEKTPYWDDILNNKIICSPELQERFVIEIPITEDTATYKQLTAKTLCECELSQIMLYNIEINTEDDILRDDYTEPSTFYNPDNPETSILHRILEKAPHYTIKHVDESLINLTKVPQFSFSDKDIYSVLTGDLAEEFNCIFIFDSMDRSISVYDLYNTCHNCGYRGEFNGECPECGSNVYSGKYGNDTTIYIDNTNLATSISLQPDTDALKNCFYVEGGDDTINAAIKSINPNGSNYIYYFNNETIGDMSEVLKNTLSDYSDLYEYYNSTCNYHLSPEAVSKYNNVVQYILDKFGDSSDYSTSISKLPSDTLIGYPATTDAMYNATNLYYILKTSMMPTIDTDGQGIQDSMDAIINGFQSGFVSKDASTVIFSNQVAINNCTLASQNDIERAILGTSKVFYGTAYYDLEVITVSYVQATASTNGSWVGKFKLTSLTETDSDGNKISLLSGNITLEIIENNELYTQQEIARAISKKDELSEKQIASISLSLNDYNNQLHYYSLDELNNIIDMFQTCKDILVVTDEASDMDDTLLQTYETFYNERILNAQIEKSFRETQIQYVKNIYFSGDKNNGYLPSGALYDIRIDVVNQLNFDNYIINNAGESYLKEFYSYRREDRYSNQYYISDGMTDSEIINRAKELLDEAKKEIIKAGTLQYSISTTLNNLLQMTEFKPIIDDFNVGNWVRIRINDDIYQLRLLSYETDFSDITKINVEFSTVEKMYSGYSDIESVINSAITMSTSYPATIKQIESTTSTANKINNLVSDGLNATRIKYVDSDNEDIVFDNHGILARHYDYINNRYDNNQLKILSNGLYTTSDGWNSIDTGIGRITYRDPDTNQWIDDYGIIAKTVIGKLFIGEKLKIYGANNSIILDDNGITLDGGSITWSSTIPQSSITGLVSKLTELDDRVETFSQTNDPSTDWTTTDLKELHLQDLWFNPTDGLTKRWTKANNTYQWDMITDSQLEALAQSKATVFVTKPSSYNAKDLWILEIENADGANSAYPAYKKGSVLISSTTSSNYNKSHWTENVRYTDDTTALQAIQDAADALESAKYYSDGKDSALSTSLTSAYERYTDSKVSRLDSAVANWFHINGGTVVGGNYIMSPYIAGGYLNIVNNDNTKQVIIDPSNLTNTGYIFAVKNNSQFVMSLDTSGNAIFSGDLKVNYNSTTNTYDFVIDENGIQFDYINSNAYNFLINENGIYFDYNVGYSAYNFIVDNNGLKLGVGNGGATYGLVISNGGNITSNGSLLVNGSLNIGNGAVTYNSTDGFKLNDVVLTSPIINFYSSILQSNFGSIAGDDSSYMLKLNSRHLYLESTHGNITLSPGTFVRIIAHLKIVSPINTDTRSISITHSDISLINNNTTCSISCGSSGNLSLTNSSSTAVGVIGSSFSVPTDADGNVQLGRSNARWSTVYATSSTISTSDRNMKKDINEINNKYEQFFMKLLPVSYMFKNGTSGRTHIGFISQDVETAMAECGLTDLDFAGFCKDIKQETYKDENGNECTRDVTDENGNNVYIYSLRYEEFIALNTHMIQNCISKIDTLENRIKNIEEAIA